MKWVRSFAVHSVQAQAFEAEIVKHFATFSSEKSAIFSAVHKKIHRNIVQVEY